jgi:hypothetical protein
MMGKEGFGHATDYMWGIFNGQFVTREEGRCAFEVCIKIGIGR